MIIISIVNKAEVPATLETSSEGMIVRFFKHNPSLLRCDRSNLLRLINEGKTSIPFTQFEVRVLKKTVVVTLKRHISGHGQVRVNKEKFLVFLAS